MLTYIPVGVDVPRDSLKNGALCNPDGHGWAVANNSELIVGKSMKADEAIDGLVEARNSLPGSAAIFHSRWATHGAINEFNTHPFHVSESAVMAHNGIMPREYQPARGDVRSDTRVFADLVAQQFVQNPNQFPSRRAGQRIAKLIGSGNKLVFLGKGPRVRIVNESAGYQSGGVWYSNADFRGNRYKYTGYSSTSTSDFDYGEYDSYSAYLAAKYGWNTSPPTPPQTTAAVLPYRPPSYVQPDPCPLCGSTSLDLENGLCRVCHACLDCGDPITQCQCWVPATKQSPFDYEGLSANE